MSDIVRIQMMGSFLIYINEQRVENPVSKSRKGTALVEYLSENGFTVFISSGSERALVRELIRGTLDAWIAPDRVIGSTFPRRYMKNARRKIGKTQEQLAEEMNISMRQISRFENNEYLERYGKFIDLVVFLKLYKRTDED